MPPAVLEAIMTLRGLSVCLPGRYGHFAELANSPIHAQPCPSYVPSELPPTSQCPGTTDRYLSHAPEPAGNTQPGTVAKCRSRREATLGCVWGNTLSPDGVECYASQAPTPDRAKTATNFAIPPPPGPNQRVPVEKHRHGVPAPSRSRRRALDT